MLLEKLYDCRIDWQYGVADFSTLKTKAISKRQYLPILIFGLLPKLSDVLQKQVLLFLINCVNVRFCSFSHCNAQERTHNVEIFFETDILRKCIFMLMSLHKYNVFDAQNPSEIPSFSIQLSDDSIKIIYDFIYTLASHVFASVCFDVECPSAGPENDSSSVPSGYVCERSGRKQSRVGSLDRLEVRSVFRSGDYLGTLLRISQSSTSPPSFFSWNQPAVGIVATPSCAWPKNGFTLFAWVCVESFSQSGSRVPLWGFRRECEVDSMCRTQEIDI